MSGNYVVYSAQGYWGQGTFTSDLKVAKRFSRDEAIAFCRKRYNPLGTISIALPIAEEDILAVLAK